MADLKAIAEELVNLTVKDCPPSHEHVPTRTASTK